MSGHENKNFFSIRKSEYRNLFSTPVSIFINKSPQKEKGVVPPKKNKSNLKLVLWLKFISLLFSVFNLALIFYETELLFSNNYVISQKNNLLRGIIFLLCFIHSTLVFKIYLLDKHNQEASSLLSTPIASNMKKRDLIIDIIISMMHVPPGLNEIIDFFQMGIYTRLSISDIMLPFSFFRLKFLLVFLSQAHKINNTRYSLILSCHKIDHRFLFMMKSIKKEKPFQVLLGILGLTVLIVGLLLRAFEKSITPNSIWNWLWFGFVTESTVGYGDIYPKTHMGRLISGLAAITGVFIFSYKVAEVRELCKLSKIELQLCNSIYKNKQIYTKLFVQSVILIQKWWKTNLYKSIHCHFKMLKEAKKFQMMNKQIKAESEFRFEKQLIESSLIIENNFRKCKKRLYNANSFKVLASVFAEKHHLNMRKLKKLYSPNEENAHTLSVKQKSNNKGWNMFKKRSEAVKKLYLRTLKSPSASLCLSPCMSKGRSDLDSNRESSVLSMVDLD
ncbi:hypothetical protein SteCoe_14247 [Stentor coeruleus]|uniref:Potassium channel domain-containing protein n=1 Tax=Stentor coeruleus TaxID=5963 RepID=A0A1R2C6F2_9CILI|nr:hypothetical protein SteCoe_14247 [Stentor coeruleus]